MMKRPSAQSNESRLAGLKPPRSYYMTRRFQNDMTRRQAIIARFRPMAPGTVGSIGRTATALTERLRTRRIVMPIALPADKRPAAPTSRGYPPAALRTAPTLTSGSRYSPLNQDSEALRVDRLQDDQRPGMGAFLAAPSPASGYPYSTEGATGASRPGYPGRLPREKSVLGEYWNDRDGSGAAAASVRPMYPTFTSMREDSLARSLPVSYVAGGVAEGGRADLEFSLSWPPIPVVSWLGTAPAVPAPAEPETFSVGLPSLPFATPPAFSKPENAAMRIPSVGPMDSATALWRKAETPVAGSPFIAPVRLPIVTPVWRTESMVSPGLIRASPPREAVDRRDEEDGPAIGVLRRALPMVTVSPFRPAMRAADVTPAPQALRAILSPGTEPRRVPHDVRPFSDSRGEENRLVMRESSSAAQDATREAGSENQVGTHLAGYGSFPLPHSLVTRDAARRPNGVVGALHTIVPAGSEILIPEVGRSWRSSGVPSGQPWREERSLLSGPALSGPGNLPPFLAALHGRNEARGLSNTLARQAPGIYLENGSLQFPSTPLLKLGEERIFRIAGAPNGRLVSPENAGIPVLRATSTRRNRQGPDVRPPTFPAFDPATWERKPATIDGYRPPVPTGLAVGGRDTGPGDAPSIDSTRREHSIPERRPIASRRNGGRGARPLALGVSANSLSSTSRRTAHMPIEQSSITAIPPILERAPERYYPAAGGGVRAGEYSNLLIQRSAAGSSPDAVTAPTGTGAPSTGGPHEGGSGAADPESAANDIHLLANEVWYLLKRRIAVESERRGG
jgi:hypothetical protein